MYKNGSNTAKATVLIIIFSAFSKILGLLREGAFANFYGASYISDAYKVAFEIPSVLLSLFTAALGTIIIPVCSSYIKKKNDSEKNYYLNNIITLSLITAFIIMAAGIIAAPLLISVITPGFTGEVYSLTVSLTKIMFPCILFYTLSSLFSGYLNIHEKFFFPAFKWIPQNIIVIAGIFLLNGWGIEWVSYATLISVVILAVVQFPAMLWGGFKYKLIIDFRDEGLKKTVALLLPVLISGAFSEIYIIVDRVLASMLDEGSISALAYGNRINSLVYSVFITAVLTVIYPKLNYMADSAEDFKLMLGKGIRIITILCVPVTVFFIMMRHEIVSILFERGAFDSEDVYNTATALGCYSAGILGVGIRELFNRAFYSLGDTKTTMLNSIIAISINIVLNIIMVRIWGVGGLAAATSISATVSGIMLGIRLKKKTGRIINKELASLYLKLVTTGVFLIIVIYTTRHFVGAFFNFKDVFLSNIFLLLTCTITGMGWYLGMLSIFKVKEIKYVNNLIKKITKIIDRAG